MSIQRLIEFWNSHTDYKWWQMLLIGLFILGLNFILCVAIWYFGRETMLEYGYLPRKRKLTRNQFARPPLKHLFLIKLVVKAEKNSFIIFIHWCCHASNIFAFVASCVGFVGTMITLADGWAFTLLVFPPITMLFFRVLITSIPDIILLPSERNRYKIKKR